MVKGTTESLHLYPRVGGRERRNERSLLRLQSPPLVTHLPQQGHISLSSQNSSTNWRLSILIYKCMRAVVIQTISVCVCVHKGAYAIAHMWKSDNNVVAFSFILPWILWIILRSPGLHKKCLLMLSHLTSTNNINIFSDCFYNCYFLGYMWF